MGRQGQPVLRRVPQEGGVQGDGTGHPYRPVPRQEAARHGRQDRRQRDRAAGHDCADPEDHPQRTSAATQDREKTNWFFGDKAPEPKKVEKVERTDKELDKLGKEFDELKVSEAKKKKEEISRLNNEKVEKLAKKAKEREPFRL